MYNFFFHLWCFDYVGIIFILVLMSNWLVVLFLQTHLKFYLDSRQSSHLKRLWYYYLGSLMSYRGKLLVISFNFLTGTFDHFVEFDAFIIQIRIFFNNTCPKCLGLSEVDVTIMTWTNQIAPWSCPAPESVVPQAFSQACCA